jgi:hypothetical protein
VLQVVDLVKETTKGGRTPFLMTGDFNAGPDLNEVRARVLLGAVHSKHAVWLQAASPMS